MPDSETATERKPRTVKPSEYIVEIRLSADDEPERWGCVGEHSSVDDTAAGLRWIRKHGVEGKTYRVARICAGPSTVRIEKKEVRKLA